MPAAAIIHIRGSVCIPRGLLSAAKDLGDADAAIFVEKEPRLTGASVGLWSYAQTVLSF
jgi:hypothetical protein